ncbi:hypothetical protein FJZ36_00860 [Candidatus Poribacteria bacterium]|nr:hypothetical protein [Candidatus Poribacteria bacterium]
MRRVWTHRSSRARWIVAALVLAAVSRSWAEPPASPADVGAFLAADPPESSGILAQTAQKPAYAKFRSLLQADRKHFRTATADPMRGWSKANIPADAPATVLYPFAGPDFLNAYLMYPNADTYVLIGLEHGGKVPDLSAMDARGNLAAGLSTFRTALMTLMYVNFFVTNRMEVEIDDAPIPGVTPVLLAMMRMLDLEPIRVDPIQIDVRGKIALVPEDSPRRQAQWEGYSSVRVGFRRSDGRERSVIYLSMDISNAGLAKHSYWVGYLESLGQVSCLIKAGSYLMHSANFTTIRDIVLDQAQIVAQDDSGVPLKRFDRDRWKLRAFGVYTKPIQRFTNKLQPDLRAFYAEDAEPLLFPWGYGNDAKKPNLLLAVRRADAQ